MAAKGRIGLVKRDVELGGSLEVAGEADGLLGQPCGPVGSEFGKVDNLDGHGGDVSDGLGPVGAGGGAAGHDEFLEGAGRLSFFEEEGDSSGGGLHVASQGNVRTAGVGVGGQCVDQAGGRRLRIDVDGAGGRLVGPGGLEAVELIESELIVGKEFFEACAEGSEDGDEAEEVGIEVSAGVDDVGGVVKDGLVSLSGEDPGGAGAEHDAAVGQEVGCCHDCVLVVAAGGKVYGGGADAEVFGDELGVVGDGGQGFYAEANPVEDVVVVAALLEVEQAGDLGVGDVGDKGAGKAGVNVVGHGGDEVILEVGQVAVELFEFERGQPGAGLPACEAVEWTRGDDGGEFLDGAFGSVSEPGVAWSDGLEVFVEEDEAAALGGESGGEGVSGLGGGGGKAEQNLLGVLSPTVGVELVLRVGCGRSQRGAVAYLALVVEQDGFGVRGSDVNTGVEHDGLLCRADGIVPRDGCRVN